MVVIASTLTVLLTQWHGFFVVRGRIMLIADTYVHSADLLKNMSRPEAAAEGAVAWVISERELREKLKEREAKERELEKEVRLTNDLVTMSSANLSFSYMSLRRRKEKRRKARQWRRRQKPRRKRPRRMIR